MAICIDPSATVIQSLWRPSIDGPFLSRIQSSILTKRMRKVGSQIWRRRKLSELRNTVLEDSDSRIESSSLDLVHHLLLYDIPITSPIWFEVISGNGGDTEVWTNPKRSNLFNDVFMTHLLTVHVIIPCPAFSLMNRNILLMTLRYDVCNKI